MRLAPLFVALAACSVPDKLLDDGGAPPVDAPPASGPDTTITSSPPAADNSATATFEFDASIANATFACALDLDPYTSCKSPMQYTQLEAGTHRFAVRASDPLGYPDPTPAIFDWTIDLSTPNTTIDYGPAALVNTTAAELGFSSTNAPNPTYVCMLDGVGAPCHSPVMYQSLAERSHTFAVSVTSEGVADPTPAQRTWTIDVTAPTTTIDGGPTDTESITTADFAFHAGEAATFACWVDSGAASACTSPVTVGPFADGAHVFHVAATDPAGNVEASPPQRTWMIDSTSPVATITQGPPASTQSSTATFAFTSEAGATFRCSVDGAPLAMCTSPFTTASLVEGMHTFAVAAVDSVGNVQAPLTARSWTIDQTPPDTTIQTNPGSLVASTSASFTFSATESPVTFACKLDGGAYAACPASDTITGLGQGSHQLFVRATDAAGNTDPSPPQWSWTVDTVAPTASVSSGPPSTNRVGLVTFTFAASEGGASFDCALDAAALVHCANPYKTWIDNGAHTMHVRAHDGVGNVGAATAFNWTQNLANLIFISSYLQSANLGGLSGADNICASTASAAGLHGVYRPWISTTSVNAIDRLGAARGWVRLDGKPFADTQADLAAGKIFYPPQLDANGVLDDFGPVLTGTDPSGHYDATGGSCLDWTSTDPADHATGGYSSETSVGWSVNGGEGCAQEPYRIYCLGTDYTTAVAPPAPTGRRAFMSVTKWTPGGGLASADAVCATEASAAGLSGTFKALLATSTASAMSRFSSTGAPWVRVDGVPIAPTAAALFDPDLVYLDTSVNVTAAGAYVGETVTFGDMFWSGARLVAGKYTCNDWKDGTSTMSGGTGYADATIVNWIFDGAAFPCDYSKRLLCFQQ